MKFTLDSIGKVINTVYICFKWCYRLLLDPILVPWMLKELHLQKLSTTVKKLSTRCTMVYFAHLKTTSHSYRQFGSLSVFSLQQDGGILFRKYLHSREYCKCLRLWRVNDFAYKIVRNKRKNFTMESAGGDLLSLYLERQEESTRRVFWLYTILCYACIDASLSDSYLRDVVLNFVIAGRDTTAQALSWSFFRLCKHPDIQQRVYDNIMDVLKDRTEKHLTYELLQEMRYLDAFCMEVWILPSKVT